jgi:hypothetical protein
MELFIPGLIVIVLGAIVCFILLPKLAPYTLGMMSILLFVVGLYSHYTTFPYEYGSNMRELMHDYAGLIMLVVTILGFIVAIMLVYGGNPPPMSSMPIISSLPAMPAMPSLPSLGNTGPKRNSIISNSFKTA